MELNHDAERSTLVLGSGRSGTTWMAEAIARHTASRLMFEPFHPLWSPRRDRLQLFLGEEDPDQRMVATVNEVVTGRARKFEVDQVVVTRFPRSRVIKDIHTTNLLPWFSEHFPQVPVIYAVRHPIATALSRKRFGSFFGLAAYLETPAGREDAEHSPIGDLLPAYDAHREHPESLVRLVAEWCIENTYPLSRMNGTKALLTFYETATLDPIAELTRLAEFCSSALGSSGRHAFQLEALRAPSSKDWFGNAAAAKSSQDWTAVLSKWTSEVPTITTRRCVQVLEEFGMDTFYGEEPMPRQQHNGA
jgi:hypothetical protein